MVTPLVADGALTLALGIHAELLGRLRFVDGHLAPWWLGYARDGANLAAASMLWGAYLMVGFPSAVALCASMLTTLATYLLDWIAARALKLVRVRLALALPLAAWIAAVASEPTQIERTLAQMIAAVQPR